ncbi:helix-turn-helix domain-containing protein [Bacillus sp. Marseille-P3661]|uniref:helix-turn-helix domain-containing protein n=1 Tax=Bacillus sp. Marseille-P3661 TaxID=1936234 RepID=UPI000C84FEB8|nr:helix-turn-helix domain-containing protein [Bacillus sp. Marseille-P3661]
MNKEEIINILSDKIKLVRTESNYTQERMAEILGISKKTLVQIEKGRVKANWTCVVALCALFRESSIIHSVLGDSPLEVIETVAHNSFSITKEKTFGGRVWWREIERQGVYRVQQNLLSNHYRILDKDNYRWYSSFDLQETISRLDELCKEKWE